MASFAGPSIVNFHQGLVLHLDAINTRSYNTATSTSTWIDISGNNNSQTLTNSPTYNGTSFNFNGTGYATTTSNLVNGLASNSTEFSVSIWFNYNSTAGYTAAFEKQSGVGGAVPRMDIGYIGGGTNLIYWTTWYQPTAAVNDMTYGTIINAGTWYHTVLTSSAVVGKIGYLNGQPVASGAAIASWPDATQPLGISGKLRPMNGSISIVQIYNRALTASEVNQDYQAFRDRYGL